MWILRPAETVKYIDGLVTKNQSRCEKSSVCLILPIIAFVRTHPNLGVPLVQSHKFSKHRGRLPIGRPYWFYQEHPGRQTGLLSTRFRFRKWRTRIRNQWLPLVSTIYSTTEGFDLFALLSFNPKSVSQQILIGFVDQLEINEPEDPQAKDEPELGNGRSLFVTASISV